MEKITLRLIAVLFVMVSCQPAPTPAPVPTNPPSPTPVPTLPPPTPLVILPTPTLPPPTPTVILPTSTTIPLAPTSRPTAELVLSEEFSDPSSFWCQKDTSSVDWYCQDGELHAVSKDLNRFAWKGRPNSYRDFIMQVQVRFIGDAGEAAFVFRASPATPPSMYVSFLCPTGCGSLAKYTEGKQIFLIQPTELPALKKGATNTLQIVAQGSRFTFYANTVKLVQVTDASYSEGQVGIGAADGAHAVFDNLKIWVPLTAPAP